MSKIGVVVRSSSPEVEQVVGELIAWCGSRDDELIFESDSAYLPKSETKVSNLETLAIECDPIITLGGDGTLISVARFAATATSRLIGVNFGTLGFLTEIRPDELIPTLEKVLQDRAEFEVRSLLNVDVTRTNASIFKSHALNDIVLQNSQRSGLIDLDIVINNTEVMRLRADGLICATPTGSTAYSLAAGGSIVHPALEAILLTPICAHTLTTRPLVLPATQKDSVLVKIPKQKSKLALAVDGQLYFDLKAGDQVTITPAPEKVRIVKSENKSYFEILRNKLNWGIANKAN